MMGSNYAQDYCRRPTQREDRLAAELRELRAKVGRLEQRIQSRKAGVADQEWLAAWTALNAVTNDMHDLGLTGLGVKDGG